MIIKIWLVIFLIICSITDLVERHVYTMFCMANGLIIGIMHFFIRDMDLKSCLFGILHGVIILFVCILKKESIGSGDALIVGIIGLAVGFEETIEILVWTFLIITTIGIIGILKKQIVMKTKIPFIPFVLVGTIITMVVKGG